MALASSGFELTVTLIDNGGNTTNKFYALNGPADYDEAVSQAGVILAALDAVTAAVIKSYRVAEVYTEGSLVLPGVAVQIENIARIVVGIDGEINKKATLEIPAPVPDIFIDTSGPGANVVDTADAALLAYVNLFDNTGEATISDGEFIELPILSGKRVHRASNRG